MKMMMNQFCDQKWKLSSLGKIEQISGIYMDKIHN